VRFIKNVEYLGGFRLRLTFRDGAIKDVDLKSHLDGEIFEPLKDVDFFKSVRIDEDLDTIIWSNGADMSPDFLFEIGQPAEKTVSSIPDQRRSEKT